MIYLDYSATTPVDERVLDVYAWATRHLIGNPNSSHHLGTEAKTAIEKALAEVHTVLNLPASTEIILTSGASEANNLAIKGLAEKRASIGKHIITSSFEHPSVTGPLNYLSKKGYSVDFVHTDDMGRIDLKHFQSLLRSDTILVSVCAVNGEIGIVQPLHEMAQILKQYPNAVLHSDATQAVGKYPIDLNDIDLACFSAHKFYGPKGIGALVRKNKALLEPQIHGGHSTSTFRSGTPATPLIIAFAEALKLACENLNEKVSRVQMLNDYTREHLSKLPRVVFNSSSGTCIPHILNVSLLGFFSRNTVLFLEKKDIFLSNHSACSSEAEHSDAVFALCHDEERARSSIRISLSFKTQIDEIDALMKALQEMVGRS